MGTSTPVSAETSETKLTTETIAEGSISCIRFAGTIDESFDGQRLASGIRAKTLIAHMRDVRKISSFGIREWSNFIKGVERSVESLYLIDCSPKVVDQINMVANFAGKAKIFSFYGPYRCDYCDVDRQVLFQVDRDADDIRGLRPRDELCESCGREQYFDEDPASFLSFVASQPQFSLPPEVADFLATKLDYSITGADRHLQIDKFVDGRYTFLRLTGDLDGTLPSEKLAEGLEGVVVVDAAGVGNVDMAGAAEWRNFISLARAGAEIVYCSECPPLLLERLGRAEDLGDRVISFSMPYSCSSCATTSSQLIEVDEHHDILRFATPPEMKCQQCKQPTTCVAPETLLSRLRSLARPEVDSSLRAFIKKAKKRKVEQAPAEEDERRSGTSMLALAVGLVAILGAGGALAFNIVQTKGIQKQMETQQPGTTGGGGAREASLPERPGWITADTPAFAYCTDFISRISCVGVSPFTSEQELGREDAKNAALEELVNSISIKIEDETFNEDVRPLFADARRTALLELDQADGERMSDAYPAVQSARRRAAEAFTATGGQAVPVQQSDWYWEEYPVAGRESTEFLVFVRYDISLDAVRALIDTYTKPVEVDGARVVTAFPLIAWSHEDFEGAAMVLESDRTFSRAGASAGTFVVGVNGTPVKTARDFASAASAATDDLEVESLVVAGVSERQME